MKSSRNIILSPLISEKGANLRTDQNKFIFQNLVRTGNNGTGTPLRWSKSNLPSGTYLVRLYFMEKWKRTPAIFDIVVQGTTRVSSYEPLIASGEIKVRTGAVVEISGVSVTDGTLSIVLDPVMNYPSLCGIEIVGTPD